jgi:hypothetical protein
MQLLADRDLDRAFEHPDLMMDGRLAAAALIGDVRAGREYHLDDPDRRRVAAGRYVAPDVAGGGVAPKRLVGLA